MPTYLYLCEECNEEFEEYHSMSEKVDHCPMCEKNGKTASVKRLINCLNKGTVELYGQELVNKVMGDAQQIKRDAAKNENQYANLLGEDNFQQLQTSYDKSKREKY